MKARVCLRCVIYVVNYYIFSRFQSGKTKGTIVKGLTNIYHKEGLRAYWNGNGANVIKIMPESALRFLSYEAFKSGICQARLKGGEVGLLWGFLVNMALTYISTGFSASAV